MKARSQAKPKRFRRYESTGLTGTLQTLPRPTLPRINGRWIALGAIGVAVIAAVLFVIFGDTFYVTRVSVVGQYAHVRPGNLADQRDWRGAYFVGESWRSRRSGLPAASRRSRARASIASCPTSVQSKCRNGSPAWRGSSAER